jgi:four helix bundle protein
VLGTDVVGCWEITQRGARRFQELVAWQLAHELKCEIFTCTSTGPAARDFDYKDQIRRAGASAPANIAEGFGRFRPRDFARFLEFACASLVEIENHLIDGRDRGYFDAALYGRLSNLRRAAHRATLNLLLVKKRQRDAP